MNVLLFQRSIYILPDSIASRKEDKMLNRVGGTTNSSVVLVLAFNSTFLLRGLC